MKVIKLMLKILLPILLLIITASFVLENVVVKTITEEIMAKKISGYILDEIILDIDSNKLIDIDERIRDSQYCEKITFQYVNVLIANTIYDENKKLDITEEIKSIIEKELKNEIEESKKEKLYHYLQEQSENLVGRLESYLPIGYNRYDIPPLFLQLYHAMTNLNFRIIVGLVLVIDIITLIVLEKYKALKSFQLGLMITAIVSIIVFAIIKICSNYIEQTLTGGWVDNINLNLLITFIVVEIVSSIVLYLIRRNLKENSDIYQANKL